MAGLCVVVIVVRESFHNDIGSCCCVSLWEPRFFGGLDRVSVFTVHDAPHMPGRAEL